MANIKSAQKKNRRDQKKRLVNLERRSALKTAVKQLLTAIDKKESKEKLDGLFVGVQAQLARAKNKRIIHANTASRKVSRLAQRVEKAKK